MTQARPRVVVCCDVGPTIGVGHLMRCVALSEEFLARGFDVVFAADAESVPWAAGQLDRRGIATVGAPSTPLELVALLRRLEAAIVVIDSYELPPEAYSAVRAAGLAVLAIVDGDIAGREADVYLDQNIGAEDEDWERPDGSLRLAGLRYALMRDEILRSRPAQADAHRDVDPVRVFAVFGGTDAFGAGPVVAGLLARAGVPFTATLVAGSQERLEAIRDVPLGDRQSIEVIAPTDHLVDHVLGADVVLSAAGTSTWELACLGAATGLVCVADNQRASYDRIRESGVTVGLGLLEEVRQDPAEAREALRGLLTDAALRTRLRASAWQLVDGHGRRRVAEAAVRLAGMPPTIGINRTCAN